MPILICKECKKVFETYDKIKRKYCSRACREISARRQKDIDRMKRQLKAREGKQCCSKCGRAYPGKASA